MLTVKQLEGIIDKLRNCEWLCGVFEDGKSRCPYCGGVLFEGHTTTCSLNWLILNVEAELEKRMKEVKRVDGES